MTTFYSILGLFLQGILVGILFASSPAEAQNLKDVKITINAKGVTLEQAFQILEKNTNFKFLYTSKEIPVGAVTDINADEESLYEILESLARNYGLIFNRINEQIVVKKSDTPVENPIILIENGSIKGKITDSQSKDPLIGASVQLKGTSLGAFTDGNGNYEIHNVKPGKYLVVVSYVGYSSSSQEVEVVSNKTISVNIELGQSVVNLDEVTVTSSISERSVRESANPVATISAKEMETKNLTYITDVLEMLPGISVSSTTDGVSNYGKKTSISGYVNLRGSVNGSSVSPSIKYYIDGVEIYDAKELDFLDPNQIEKIEISKGPMSSTLYGAGSSAGIIQIFTKKGSGAAKVELKTVFTANNDKYMANNPLTYQYSLSINGGKPDFGYKLAGSYGLYPVKRYDISNGIDEQDYSLNGNFFGTIGKFKVQFGFNYGYMNYGSTASYQSYNMAVAEGWANPERLKTTTSVTDLEAKMNSLSLNLNIKHIITDNIYQNLTFGSSGYDLTYIYNEPTTSSSVTYYPYYLYAYSVKSLKYFANWSQNLFSDFSAEVTGGVDVRKSKMSIDIDKFSTSYNEVATNLIIASSVSSWKVITATNTTGIFGEGVWGYKNKLFLTTGFRAETENSYGSNTGWYPMSRFGLTYIFSWGDFTFKPRVSYGKSTEAVNPAYTVDRITYSGTKTYYYTGSPNLKPQFQDGYEAGIDFYITNNYSLSLTAYYQEVQDMIVSTTTQLSTTEYSVTYENAKSITNKGFEISAKGIYDPFTLTLNYSYVDSRYTGSGYTSTSSYQYSGGRLTSIPSTSINARLSYRLPSSLSFSDKKGDVTLEVAFKGNWLALDYYSYYKYYCENGSYNSALAKYYKNVDGYALVSLNIAYPILNSVLLYADIKNLLNYQAIGLDFNAISGRRITFGFKCTY